MIISVSTYIDFIQSLFVLGQGLIIRLYSNTPVPIGPTHSIFKTLYSNQIKNCEISEYAILYPQISIIRNYFVIRIFMVYFQYKI